MEQNKRIIYLDNAGTTKPLPEYVNIYNYYQSENFFNPSAPYHESLVLSNEIKECRRRIISILRGDGQFIFTASGTESDNLALFGTKKANGSRIIVSASEHPAVMNTALELKQRGYDVVFCEVDECGRVITEKFKEIMTKETALVSIMHVNNETGCVNDIKTLVKIAKSVNPKVIFHSDGVQAVGKIRVNLNDLGVDLYTVSAHKIHALKGIAGLFIKNGVNVKPIIYGGGQEFGIRSATENVGGIMAFTKAIEDSVYAQKENFEKVKTLRNELKKVFLETNCICVDSGDWQSPYILCAVMPKVRGEVMLHALEKYGILIGTGSACSSKKTQKKLPSILKLVPEYEKGIIRLSLCRFTTENEIKSFMDAYKKEFVLLLKYVGGM